MPLFKRKPSLPPLSYDPETQEPAVRKSICTGEMTVGFVEKATGKFHDLMLVDAQGLEDFCRRVGQDKIKTIY